MANFCVDPLREPEKRERRRSIQGNLASLVAGQFVAALSMWLALVALAKLADPAAVGVYALAQAISTPIAETAKMGLREVRSSDTTAAFRFGDYLGLRLIATAVAMVLIAVLAAGQTDTAAIFWVIVLYGVTRCLEMVSDMIFGLFQAHERMDYIGWSLCLRGPLSLVLLVAGFWLTGSLVGAVIGQVIAHLVVLLGYELPMGRRRGSTRVTDALRPLWEPAALKALALQALPLAIASLLVMIATYIPQLTVERTLGLSDLGYFAALTALAMSPSRLVQSVGVAASVRLARFYADGDLAQFVRLLGGIALAVAALGAVGVLISTALGKTILSVVYTSDYAEHGQLLTWLVAAAAVRFVSDVLQAGMIASRRFWWLTVQYGSVALVAIVACFAFIPRLGLLGAGVAMLTIYGAQVLFVLLGLARSLRATRIDGAAP